MFDCDVMAWESVIHKSKLLCGSINKHGMRTKKILHGFKKKIV